MIRIIVFSLLLITFPIWMLFAIPIMIVDMVFFDFDFLEWLQDKISNL